MICRVNNVPWLAAALLLITAPAGAEPSVAGATEPSEIKIRVYEEFPALGPGFGSRRSPFAIDIGAALTTCPDGNTAVNALDIGGWNYQLAPPCGEQASGSRIRVDAGSAQSGTGAATSGQPPAGMRCDPATWRCAPQAP